MAAASSSGPIPALAILHIVPFGGAEWRRCLVFRDYLRANPDVAGAYAALKRDLARRFPHDHERYGAGKHAFVHEVLQRALAPGPTASP
ncbi:MAG: GrpB family protein [Chloroflexi bacterium]|nr:GrpB family protein [Chloroflexota bacterium]